MFGCDRRHLRVEAQRPAELEALLELFRLGDLVRAPDQQVQGILRANDITFPVGQIGIDGGAVFDNGGTVLTLTGSTFTDNSVDGFDGGAVGANSDTVDITGSTFTPARTAILNAAALNGAIFPVEVRVPSGKIITRYRLA